MNTQRKSNLAWRIAKGSSIILLTSGTGLFLSDILYVYRYITNFQEADANVEELTPKNKKWVESLEKTDLPFVVSRSQYENVLKELDEDLGDNDPNLGISDSVDCVSLTVARESCAFSMGGRAAMLQLAHPFVAAGIELHSNLAFGVQQRFFRTFQYMFPMTFGSRKEMYRASRIVRGLHDKVKGEIGENVGPFTAHSKFDAAQLFAIIWVGATLLESQVIAYELAFRPLTMYEKDILVKKGSRILMLFGVPKEFHHQNWQEFEQFCRAVRASPVLTVSENAKKINEFIFDAPYPFVQPFLNLTRQTSVALLPPKFQEPLFGRILTKADYVKISIHLAISRFIYRLLPGPFRWLTAYCEFLDRNNVPRSSLNKTLGNISAKLANSFVKAVLPPRDPSKLKTQMDPIKILPF